MSTSNDKLETCGCCEPETTPQRAHYNRAGLPQLTYRIGTHSDFVSRMLHQVPYQVIPDGENIGVRPLGGLTTRSTDDPAIALLDAWAMSLDVLTFYQERIANEGYLRTATERRSLLELARAIGYELSPGVAASAHVAFTCDPNPGSPKVVTVPIGTKIQNVPVKDELPQTFETIEELEARPEWNAMTPRMTEIITITAESTSVSLNGISLSIAIGDMLLFVGGEREASPASFAWFVVKAATVKEDTKRKITTVTWLEPLRKQMRPSQIFPSDLKVYVFRENTALFGHNAPDLNIMSQAVRGNYGNEGSEWAGMTVPVNGTIDLQAEYPRILPDSWVFLSGTVERTIEEQGTPQDRPNGAVGSPVIVKRTVSTTETRLYRVRDISVAARVDYSMQGKVTRIVPDTAPGSATDGVFRIRTVQVFAESEELQYTEIQSLTPIRGEKIVLSRIVLGLTPGRKVIVTGKRPRLVIAKDGLSLAPGAIVLKKGDNLQLQRAPAIVAQPPAVTVNWPLVSRGGRSGTLTQTGAERELSPGVFAWSLADKEDEVISEVAEIEEVTNDDIYTTITLTTPLVYYYDRASTTVRANVAAATHGETVNETLGAGDGSTANQRFQLKKPPLTYVAAPSGTGTESSLDVRVNGVLWSEVPYLYGEAPRGEVYIVRINNEGKTSVIFGDGRNGARLPSGLDNITARYRSGIGLIGEVEANSLSILKTRPLGIVDVTNPIEADGAAEPESTDEARLNAPKTVLTFERVVSLRDFEDFSRSFAGVAKAQAVMLWKRSTQLVYVTIAGSNGKPPGEMLRKNLATAIESLRDPSVEFEIGSFEFRTFDVTAIVVIDPRYIADDVKAAVEKALLDRFSFDNRKFGQNVSSSEVITTIQGVEGVVYVDLEHLNYTPTVGMAETAGMQHLTQLAQMSQMAQLTQLAQTARMPQRVNLNNVVLSLGARVEGGVPKAAQLLLINPLGISIISKSN